MGFISPFYCLCCIDNRYGCLIIAFVETCWLMTNFFLCVLALRKALNDWIMRLDYYRDEHTDTYAMMLAGVGVIASLVSIFFTMMLVLVAVRKGKMKLLLFPYVMKNLVVVGCEVAILYYVWLDEKTVVWSKDPKRKSFAMIVTISFGIVFQLYASFIVCMYNSELNRREQVARKLYKAWRQRMKAAEELRKIVSAHKKGGGKGGKGKRGANRGKKMVRGRR